MTNLKHYSVQGTQGQNPVVIEANSGFEALGHYLLELDDNHFCVEDVMKQVLSDKGLQGYINGGVKVYSLEESKGESYYELQGTRGESMAVIKAHSGAEALGYYLENVDVNYSGAEDVMVQKTSEKELPSYEASGVTVYTIWGQY